MPSLAVGGAEIDLVRTLPRIDRDRFRITVCTFLDRGELGETLQQAGIEVVGPLSPSLHRARGLLGRIVSRILSATKLRTLAAKLSSLGRFIGRIGHRLALRLETTRVGRFLKLGLEALRPAAGACIRVLRVPFSIFWGAVYLLEVLLLASPIARLIRQSEIDVVHTILPNSYLVGACASMLAGRRPLLMSRVSLNLYQQDYKLVGFIERRILHPAVDAAIGNSNAVVRDLKAEGVSESKLHLVYNGIDVHTFTNEMVTRSTARRLLGISDGTLIFSVVANLHPYKGHENLLPALAALRDALPSDWMCLFVGKDTRDRLPQLTRLCLSYGLSRHVAFLGPRRDVPMILSASDIHISASLQEGLPNNIIEAMCARLPVVATAVGGIPELVVNNQTGYLVPPRDVAKMTSALTALAQAPNKRREFGDAGYARAQSHFNINNNVNAFESIYFSLAGRHS